MWQVEFSAKAEKQLSKLDRHTQQEVVRFLGRLISLEEPRLTGKPLTSQFGGLWRYRVGKYRLICDIQSQRLVILIITLGKRDKIYG